MQEYGVKIIEQFLDFVFLQLLRASEPHQVIVLLGLQFAVHLETIVIQFLNILRTDT